MPLGDCTCDARECGNNIWKRRGRRREGEGGEEEEEGEKVGRRKGGGREKRREGEEEGRRKGGRRGRKEGGLGGSNGSLHIQCWSHPSVQDAWSPALCTPQCTPQSSGTWCVSRCDVPGKSRCHCWPPS